MKRKVYYAVIDTNVLVSSQLKRDSVPGWIIDQVLIGKIIPLLNQEIINEYYDVLTRNKFGFSDRQIEGLIGKIARRGLFLDRSKTEELFIDNDDIVFYEIVLTAQNYHYSYLITGNIKHFPNKKFVVTPVEMKNIIEGA